MFMTTLTLPKPLKRAINRRAYQIALSNAYQRISQDLAARAFELLDLPGATVDRVIEQLDQVSITLQTSARVED
jgi:Leu/Phe-tRNA-protein transferase